MKIDKNQIIGMFSVLVFCVYGAISVTGNLSRHVIFALLYILLFAAIFKLADSILGKYVSADKDFWLVFLPFSLLVVAARLLFGWDLLLPFYTAGFIVVGIDSLGRLTARKAPVSAAVKVAAGIFACIMLFVVLSVTGGICI